MNNSKTKFIVLTGIYSAIGTALMFFEIPWFAAGPKLGISDVVVAVAAVLVSPISAILVAIIKSVIYYFLSGGGIPIGESAAFLAAFSYIIPLMILRKRYANEEGYKMKRVLTRLILGVFTLTIVLTIANYYYITPAYFELYGLDLPDEYLKYIVTLYIPFNLAKGAIVTFLSFVLIHRLKDTRD